MGGIKLGHFFSRARWFGLETEVFYTTPHIKDQNVTISASGRFKRNSAQFQVNTIEYSPGPR